MKQLTFHVKSDSEGSKYSENTPEKFLVDLPSSFIFQTNKHYSLFLNNISIPMNYVFFQKDIVCEYIITLPENWTKPANIRTVLPIHDNKIVASVVVRHPRLWQIKADSFLYHLKIGAIDSLFKSMKRQQNQYLKWFLVTRYNIVMPAEDENGDRPLKKNYRKLELELKNGAIKVEIKIPPYLMKLLGHDRTILTVTTSPLIVLEAFGKTEGFDLTEECRVENIFIECSICEPSSYSRRILKIINTHHEISNNNWHADRAEMHRYLHYEAKTFDYHPVFETSHEMKFKISISGGSAFDYCLANVTAKTPTILTCTIIED
jgi:hypothetical protein